ncbi:MCE family protein [Nocardia sp. NBC_01503]|uniref:MCE family protein n=1 Tax=Nocardia sp. NBC_01503 TaxID=2975997 RepID=UPI002E7BEDAB|nr:MCE family protein [Nocardia sp. NBC_01503]WTL30180.1 MCE family protein [Nocardia sp. NBC_01503]
MRNARLITRLTLLCVVGLLSASCSLPQGFTSLSELWGYDRIHLTADFESVAGLYVGNEVDVLGLPVGSVDAITPKGAYVEVRMSLDAGTEVPAQALAALVSPQLITNRHVELTPAYTGDGPVLTDGTHIPLEHTRTPVDLDRILRNFDQLGQSLKGSSTDGPMASRALFPMLDGNGDKIRRTLDALASALQVSLADKDQISTTIVKLNEITQIVADNDQTVRDFSGRLTELVALLRDQAPGLQAVLTQLDDFVTNTGSVVAENRGPLTAALTRLTTITQQMRDSAPGLTEIVDVAPLFFQNFANATSTEQGALRLHLLTDKSLLDNETLALFCERLLVRSDGCRTGKLQDFGPDFGLTAALLGFTR